MALVQVSEPSSLVWEREIWGGLTKNQSLNTEALTQDEGSGQYWEICAGELKPKVQEKSSQKHRIQEGPEAKKKENQVAEAKPYSKRRGDCCCRQVLGLLYE